MNTNLCIGGRGPHEYEYEMHDPWLQGVEPKKLFHPVLLHNEIGTLGQMSFQEDMTWIQRGNSSFHKYWSVLCSTEWILLKWETDYPYYSHINNINAVVLWLKLGWNLFSVSACVLSQQICKRQFKPLNSPQKSCRFCYFFSNIFEILKMCNN